MLISLNEYRKMSHDSSVTEMALTGEEDFKNSSALENQKLPPQSSPAPDGGFQAWMVVVGSFFSLFVSFGWVNCAYWAPQLKYFISY